MAIGQVEGGVGGERQQVLDDEDGGEVRLAVAEIVFGVVALGFQHIERLVFDLPPRPAGRGHGGDVVAGDRQVSDEAVAVGDLAVPVAVSIENQLTLIALSSPRIGTLHIQRYR